MDKGIIVSIQKYTIETTQELAGIAIESGAVGIRTDQPILVDVPVIGLEKNEKEYYITTTKEAILRIGKWADYIAIDSRKGNRDIGLLYAYCHINEFKIVADIEKVEDVSNLLRICFENKIIPPEYIATTFSKGNIDLIKQIKDITNIPVIAEGEYSLKWQIEKAKKLEANNICIGSAISDIYKLTKRFVNYYGK